MDTTRGFTIQLPEAVKDVARAEEAKTSERIIDAYEVALTWAGQIQDESYKAATITKLGRSNVKGSRLEGVRGSDDVLAMLKSVTKWRPVLANLKDDKIECLQGILQNQYADKAYAAYATVEEIHDVYGNDGLTMIRAKKGYQGQDEYYFCTVLRVPTDVVTVQLKKDESGVEHVHQWFVGYEVSSIVARGDGDRIVRCNVQIPRTNDPRRENFRPRTGR